MFAAVIVLECTRTVNSKKGHLKDQGHFTIFDSSGGMTTFRNSII